MNDEILALNKPQQYKVDHNGAVLENICQ